MLPPLRSVVKRASSVGFTKFVSRTREGKKLPVDRYRFAPQDHDVRTRRNLYVSKDEELGTVEAIDLATRTIDVKKRRASVDLHPEAVFCAGERSSETNPRGTGEVGA